MSEPIICCRGVTKTYRVGAGGRGHGEGRVVEALRGVDLLVDRPGFFAIMGASGSGKSTLLHLLAALDKPDAGEVFVAGSALHAMGERELTLFRRKSIGIVFQQFNLISTFSAVENVELPGILAGDDAGPLRARAMELLGALGLAERAGHRPDALSGGEQQRVAIARALLYKPRVVLADEPTGNLDSASSARLWRVLAEVARAQAVTMVMVTHEPSAAANCERAFVVSDGRVVGQIETEGMDAGGVAARYQQLVRAA
jgi:putative ABC transport system ATP-binding protein